MIPMPCTCWAWPPSSAATTRRTVELISQAIDRFDGNPAFHNNLGEAYRALGRLPEAQACYQRALTLDPGFAAAHYNLGLTYGAQQAAAAQHHYQQAVALAPRHVLARNNLANVLRAQGHVEEAMAAYREALAIEPNCLEVLLNLGATLTQQQRAAEALPYLQRAVRLQPDSIEGRRQLGRARVPRPAMRRRP